MIAASLMQEAGVATKLKSNSAKGTLPKEINVSIVQPADVLNHVVQVCLSYRSPYATVEKSGAFTLLLSTMRFLLENVEQRKRAAVGLQRAQVVPGALKVRATNYFIASRLPFQEGLERRCLQ